MLAARGVSLGLGKINLSDLNQLPSSKHRSALLKREEKKKPPRVIIKKKADSKTVWAACRAVIFGCIVISVGLAMTFLGYFDKHFSERSIIVNGVEQKTHDKVVQIQLKSMQYLGPVLMGIGSFILIVACVVTLESRDKHAQIITGDAIFNKRKRLLSSTGNEDLEIQQKQKQEPSKRRSICATVEIHHPIHGLAPLADEDSLDLRSYSSEIFLTETVNVDNEETYH